jgi:hypothetical protein
MKLLLATALTTLAVCIAAIGCGSDDQTTSQPATGVPPEFFGVVPQGGLTDDDLDRMAAGKVGTLRVVLPWSLLDPSPKEGDTDLSTIDPVILGAARRGIRVLPTLFSTPPWVAQQLDHADCTDTCGSFAPASAAAQEAWKNFVTEMVDRYGPDGELWASHPDVTPLPVRAWQIWNEQNSPTYFQPAPDPQAYADLLRIASDAIRKRDPGAQIVLGGMFQTNGHNGAILASDFLRQLYDIDDVRDDFDAVAAHPYAHQLDNLEGQVELLHDEIVRAHDDASMWVTEVGASSADGDNPLEIGEQGQAELLRGAFQFLLSKRTAWNIDGVIWYSWRDTDPAFAACAWCANSGLFPIESLTPKPAWGAFTSFTGGT